MKGVERSPTQHMNMNVFTSDKKIHNYLSMSVQLHMYLCVCTCLVLFIHIYFLCDIRGSTRLAAACAGACAKTLNCVKMQRKGTTINRKSTSSVGMVLNCVPVCSKRGGGALHKLVFAVCECWCKNKTFQYSCDKFSEGECS